jgi:2-dehydro-3-deoxyphosphogalactonate aldolase
MTVADDLFATLAGAPLVAILRGVRPEEAVAIGRALVAGGVRVIEVPLNSPDPLSSIAALATDLGGRALVGAGTVMTTTEVAAVADAGGRLIVSPTVDAEVIAATRARGLASLPGAFTPTEIAAAHRAGADAVKLFPAEVMGIGGIKAVRAVFPPAVRMIAVGGVTADTARAMLAAGCVGLGVGSALYRPGATPDRVAAAAAAFRDGLAG